MLATAPTWPENWRPSSTDKPPPRPERPDLKGSKMAKPVTTNQTAGDFDWRTDPNFQFEAPKAPSPAPAQVPSSAGPSLLDTVVATRQMLGGKAAATAPARRDNLIEKARTFVGDGIGKVVGAIDDSAGNQVQSRVAGMRMKNDRAQATEAANAYAAAVGSAETPEQAQAYKDAAANIAKGANVAVPEAAEGGATLAGSLAEGASRAIPALGVMAAAGAFADGGEVERAEFSRAWNRLFEKGVIADRVPSRNGNHRNSGHDEFARAFNAD